MDTLLSMLSAIISIFSIAITVIITLLLFWMINYYYINYKTKDEFERGKYRAVVLTNTDLNDKLIYLSGIMFLIMYFKKAPIGAI